MKEAARARGKKTEKEKPNQPEQKMDKQIRNAIVQDILRQADSDPRLLRVILTL